jgi:hypothetical protein
VTINAPHSGEAFRDQLAQLARGASVGHELAYRAEIKRRDRVHGFFQSERNPASLPENSRLSATEGSTGIQYFLPGQCFYAVFFESNA